MGKQMTLEQNAEALKRWRTRLKRAMTAIDKLERQRKRLEAKPPVVKTPPVEITPPVAPAPPVETKPPVDALVLPSFLDRTKVDPVAEQIREEQADTKRRKARGRIEKMKAKQRGDLKKMPLTGRAAMDAIRNG